MFKPENAHLDNFSTTPALLEALKLLHAWRIQPYELIHDASEFFMALAETERSSRSVQKIIDTMLDLDLQMTTDIWSAYLDVLVKYSGHTEQLNLEDIIQWAKGAGESIKTFNKILEIILYNTISEVCANPMQSLAQRDMTIKCDPSNKEFFERP
eukprot:UN24411